VHTLLPACLYGLDLGTIAIARQHLGIIDAHLADVIGKRACGAQACIDSLLLIGIFAQNDAG